MCAWPNVLPSKQGAPDRCTYLLLLFFKRSSSRTKSKGFLIDVPLCFHYFLHMHHHVQKARGSRSKLLSASTTFYMCIATYKKQGAPDRCTSMLLLHFTHTSSHTKSKGLPTSTSLYFSYMFVTMHEK
jgi:hypothetical protein